MVENYITESQLFDSLTPKEKELLIKNSRIVCFDEKEAIFKQGSFAVNCYIVLEGLCKLTYQIGEKKRILNLLHKGEMIGKDYSSFDNYPYSAHSLTKSKMLVIPINFLNHICDTNPKFYIQLSNKLQNYLLNIIEWLVNIGFRNTEGAVALFILKFYDNPYTMELSRYEIAEIIGYSRESIIHTIKDFVKEGLIETKGKDLIIKDKEKLAEIAKYG